MAALRNYLLRSREHAFLALMLLLLHTALWSDFGSALSRAVMLAHLGVFLLWQPVWRGDQRLDRRGLLIFSTLTIAFVYWLNWWFILIWLLLLSGLVGGRIFVGQSERYAYGLALGVLVSELLIGAVRPMFAVPLSTEVSGLFRYGLPILAFTLILFPGAKTTEDERRPVDFLHGLTVAMFITILALGSLLVMYSTGVEYGVALFQTLLTIALSLFAISWLLVPRPGFVGIGQLWARYLLNVGTPLEQWLERLTRVSRGSQTPQAFLSSAMAQLVELPWVAGVRWKSSSGEGESGRQTSHTAHLETDGIEVTLYTPRPAGTTLLIHGRLLVQLIGGFNAAKLAEHELAKGAHLKAVHETGARLTHDIKNLLQTLHTMTVAVQEEHPSAEVQRLLRRQLPLLSRRLQLALDKLKSPQEEEQPPGAAPMASWWRDLSARHAGRGIDFRSRVAQDLLVPVDCLDSVAENLLENARIKRQSEPDLEVTVELDSNESGLRMQVCDTGSPVPQEIVDSLFRETVSSSSGLGIGLYQAAQQAARSGLVLSLAENRRGRVCFELASEKRSSASG